MELEFSEREAAFYEEVEDFLKDALPPDWPERPLVWPGGYSPSGYRGEESWEIAREYREKDRKLSAHFRIFIQFFIRWDPEQFVRLNSRE